MADEDACKQCGKPAAEIPTECGGRGGWPFHLEDGREFWHHCPFMRSRILRARLSNAQGDIGREVATSSYLQSSPLVDGGEDLTEVNVYIQRTYWETVKRHLKRALLRRVLRAPNFTFRFTTDEEIKRVFVGNEHYVQRPKAVRENIETYNSLKDLMGSHELVICRLGRLGYKNIAGGGSLKEALMIRETKRLPTWLVDSEPGETAWMQSATWNPDVATYVATKFREVCLGDPGENVPVTETSKYESTGLVAEEESPNEPDYYAPSEQDRMNEEDRMNVSIELPSGGETKYKKKDWRKRS